MGVVVLSLLLPSGRPDFKLFNDVIQSNFVKMASMV